MPDLLIVQRELAQRYPERSSQASQPFDGFLAYDVIGMLATGDSRAES